MCLRHESECCDRPDHVPVILVVVVRVAIGKVHVPRVITIVLSGTPVVAAFLRHCIIVTEGSVAMRQCTAHDSRSKPPIQSIM